MAYRPPYRPHRYSEPIFGVSLSRLDRTLAHALDLSVPPVAAGSRRSLHDAVFEVGHAGGLDHAEQFECHLVADAVEEPRAAAQQDRDDVELYIVNESSGKLLVDDVGASAD